MIYKNINSAHANALVAAMRDIAAANVETFVQQCIESKSVDKSAERKAFIKLQTARVDIAENKPNRKSTVFEVRAPNDDEIVQARLQGKSGLRWSIHGSTADKFVIKRNERENHAWAIVQKDLNLIDGLNALLDAAYATQKVVLKVPHIETNVDGTCNVSLIDVEYRDGKLDGDDVADSDIAESALQHIAG